ncbi:DUF4625 domain-containing protein [Pontibacter sp. 13R65]|uniref:DUF4625 domain-containing protein n=1 Tax=Pontibacter sp. 13R65 TaxID=3127458 RepID=UPI00301D52D3
MYKATTNPLLNTIKNIQLLLLFLFSISLVSCNDDDEVAPVRAQPTIDKVEIGLGNNQIGVIGKDFHFNAEVVAGDKIDLVQVKIQQRVGETYTSTWSHEVTWEQYKGAKNATIHKHFDIPANAVEGVYDFLIIVTDENGTKLEDKKALTIYSAANLPIDPQLSIFDIFKNDDMFYINGALATAGDQLKKGDVFKSQVTISGVKGDGIMYLLLIDKSAKHRPESIDQIDFSIAIVYDVYEHKNWPDVDYFTNSVFDMETYTSVRDFPVLTIGASTDNNTPPAAINGAKSWKTGDYYYGVVYHNSTHNMNLFHYIEVAIDNN